MIVDFPKHLKLHLDEINDLIKPQDFVTPGNERLPDNIIEYPDISKYIKDFGREGDSCFVAEINGELVGAIWIR